MADDLEHPATSEPEGDGPDISPEAQQSLDRRLERHGLSAPAEEEPEEAPAPRRSQAPPPRDFRIPAERRREANKEWHRTVQAQAAELADVKKALAELTGLIRGDGKPIDPEEDPTGYTMNLMEEAVVKALGGKEIVGFLQESHTASQEARQQREAIRQENAFLHGWGVEMRDWEAEYAAKYPDLAEGYQQRLHAFVEASDQAQVQLGVHPAQARRETMKGLIALTDRALNQGVHPVAYVDSLWRQTIALQGGPAGGGARREQRDGNREIAERRRASAAAGGSISTTKAPPTPTTAGKLAAAIEDAPTGRGRAAAIVAAAKRAGGSAKGNLKELAHAR
jgi:hypothetical protein